MITFKNVSKEYDRKLLFKIEDLTIHHSSNFTVLLGESGVGKTTLSNMISGIDTNYNGDIFIDGSKVTKICDMVNVILQDNNLLSNLTVLENLMLFSSNEKKIRKYLKEFNIEELIDEKAYTLSGGQQKRVAIIRGLLSDSSIIILDEPSAGLDNENFDNLIEILYKVNELKHIVIITHDIRFSNYDVDYFIVKDQTVSPKAQLTGSELKSKIVSTTNKVSVIESFKLLNKSVVKPNILKSVFNLFLAVLFLIMLGLVFQEANYQLSFFNDSMDENVIYLNSGDLIEKETVVDENGNDLTFNFTNEKYAWNLNDVDYIESIDGVDSVYLLNNNVLSYADPFDNTLSKQVPKGNINILKQNLSFEYAQENINFEFATLGVPYDVAIHTLYGSPEGIKLVDGDYPKDNSNEIIIPDFIFYNEELTLLDSFYIDVINGNDEPISAEYKIIGYYETGYENLINEDYKIYVSSTSPNYEISTDDMNLIYETELAMYSETPAAAKYLEEPLSSIDKFKEFFGFGLPDMYIILEDESKMDSVYNTINKEYSDYNIINSSNINEKYKDRISYFIRIKLIYTLIFIVIFSIIAKLMFSMYSQKLQKYIAILRINNYKSNTIMSMFCINGLIDIMVMSIGSVLLIYILSLLKIPLFVNALINIKSVDTIIAFGVYCIGYVLLSLVQIFMYCKPKSILRIIKDN